MIIACSTFFLVVRRFIYLLLGLVGIMDTIKVGYMGIPFSNSEEMARVFSAKFDLKDVELIP